MRRRGMPIGIMLVFLIPGFVLLSIGIGSLAVPMATVTVGPVEIGGLTPFAAACIGSGLALIGFGSAIGASARR